MLIVCEPEDMLICCRVVPVAPVSVFMVVSSGSVMVIGALFIVVPVTGSVTVMLSCILFTLLFIVFTVSSASFLTTVISSNVFSLGRYSLFPLYFIVRLYVPGLMSALILVCSDVIVAVAIVSLFSMFMTSNSPLVTFCPVVLSLTSTVIMVLWRVLFVSAVVVVVSLFVTFTVIVVLVELYTGVSGTVIVMLFSPTGSCGLMFISPFSSLLCVCVVPLG